MRQRLEQAQVARHYLGALLFAKRFHNRDALESWQARQIQKLLARVQTHSPFYAQLWQGADLKNWRSLPTVDKAAMMAHFDSLNTAGLTKKQAFDVAMRAEESRDFTAMIGELTVGLSSGTSGHRGLFLVSPEERQHWAGHVLAKVLPAPLWQHQRIAFFLRANSTLYTSVESGKIQFRFFDLLSPLESHLNDLNTLQPTLLVAPPSMLRLLGEAIQAKQLTLSFQKIVSVAEVLEPSEKAWLENVYQQTIHQVYQCTEGFLGVTCRFGTMHLNEDLLAIQKEYLDESRGIFTPIITDFSRFTQPIIRYRLNDILIERQQPCPCGSLLMAIASIDGRCDDLLYFPALTHSGWVPIFPDFIRRVILLVDAPIQDYQVQQMDFNLLTIAIAGVISEQSEQQIQEAIRRLCVQQQCQIPEIRFQPYQQMPIHVKKRRIQRTFVLPKEPEPA